jgi:uncharacterized repeat protein (TIGR01451 family)
MKMKLTKITLGLFLILLANLLNSQTWVGAAKIGTAALGFNNMNDPYMTPLATDPFNNVVKVYNYWYSATIGANTYTNSGGSGVTSMVVVKSDINNNLIWSRNLAYGPNNYVLSASVYCDNSSNIYVTGVFGEPAATAVLNCNPFPLTAVNCYKSFIIKYDPSGTVLWSKDVKISTTQTVVTANGFYAVSGNGTNRVSFTTPLDPSASLITIASNTVDPTKSNCMIATLDNNGNWIGAYGFPIKGTNKTYGQTITYAANNDIFISGVHNDTLKFGGSIGNIINTSDNGFIFKLNPSHQPVWAKHVVSCPGAFPPAVLSNGNDVILNGGLQNTGVFGTTTLTTGSGYANYFTKIDNAGNYLMAKKMGDGVYFQKAIRNNTTIFLLGGFPNYVSSLQVDAVNLSSLLTPTTNNIPRYIVESDLNGNTLNGNITYLNDYPKGFTCDNAGNAYLAGPHNSFERFGYYTVTGAAVSYKYFYFAKYHNQGNMLGGRTFYDFNSNSIFDATDVPYNSAITTRSATDTLIVYSNYLYKSFPPAGTYSTQITNTPLYYTYAPTSYVTTFTANFGQTDTVKNFILQPIPGQNDLKVMISGTPFNRPGFPGYLYATIKNVGTVNKTGVASVVLDQNLNYTNTFPAAASVSGNTINLAYTLTPTQVKTYLITYSIAPTVTVGTNLLSILTATNVGDLTPNDNLDSLKKVVTGSYDPNAKEVSAPPSISPQFISNGYYLNYVIHFQNTGNDTAFTVILNDTLSSNLDLSTFEVLNSSHTVLTDITNGIANFKFYNIYLPDSTTNNLQSHGFVEYRVKPLSTLTVGDKVKNRAHIYFDYNSPISTNQTINTITIITSINENDFERSISLYPNPSDGLLNIKAESAIHKIEVINSAGQLMISNSCSDVNGTVDLRTLTPGIYLIKVDTKDGTVVKKVIKN